MSFKKELSATVEALAQMEMNFQEAKRVDLTDEDRKIVKTSIDTAVFSVNKMMSEIIDHHVGEALFDEMIDQLMDQTEMTKQNWTKPGTKFNEFRNLARVEVERVMKDFNKQKFPKLK